MHPYLFHLGHLYLPTFGVLAALGLLAALFFSERTAAAAGIAPDALWDAGLFAVLAAFVSSRLLLVAVHWRAFAAHPTLLLTVPSLTAGGLLLTVIATVTWLRMHRVPVLRAADAWAPCATLLWCFLALGHLAEGSDPGMFTASPLSLRMPGALSAEQPVALYATLAAAALTLLLFRYLKRRCAPGQTTGLALIAVGCTQFLLTFLRVPGTTVGPLETLEWLALAMLTFGALLYAFPGQVERQT